MRMLYEGFVSRVENSILEKKQGRTAGFAGYRTLTAVNLSLAVPKSPRGCDLIQSLCIS